MGRSGKLWGFENLGVVPDVFTAAKALGGGVPIGAMMARGDAATTLGPGQHATTYGGNPLATAAGLAVARQICEKDLLKNVQERGEQLVKGLEEVRACEATCEAKRGARGAKCTRVSARSERRGLSQGAKD